MANDAQDFCFILPETLHPPDPTGFACVASPPVFSICLHPCLLRTLVGTPHYHHIIPSCVRLSADFAGAAVSSCEFRSAMSAWPPSPCSPSCCDSQQVPCTPPPGTLPRVTARQTTVSLLPYTLHCVPWRNTMHAPYCLTSSTTLVWALFHTLPCHTNCLPNGTMAYQ